MQIFLAPENRIREAKPAREHIYEYLRKQILNGDFIAGTLFSDGEVAKAFNVSRTPVREAVQKLEAEGFVVRIPQKGNIVQGLSLIDVAHIYSVRKALETLAIRYAIRKITPEELERMKKILDKANWHITHDGRDELPLNLGKCVVEFNVVLFESCRVPKLVDVIWQQREILGPFRIFQALINEQLGARFETRRRLYEALVKKDEKEAIDAWETQLNSSFRFWVEQRGECEQKNLFEEFL